MENAVTAGCLNGKTWDQEAFKMDEDSGFERFTYQMWYNTNK